MESVDPATVSQEQPAKEEAKVEDKPVVEEIKEESKVEEPSAGAIKMSSKINPIPPDEGPVLFNIQANVRCRP